MTSYPVLIAFLTHINNAKSNEMYLKLAGKALFTIFIAGIPPGRYTQVTHIVTSDAHCVINVTTKFETNKAAYNCEKCLKD